MNWVDFVIIAAILWFVFAAFQAGFIREIVTVLAAVIGVVLAGLFYEDLADDVLLFIDNDTMANIVAFGSIFGAVILAGQMLSMVLKPTVHLLQLGIFDQLIGAIFGFVKALVFIQVFVVVFVTFPRWGLKDDIEDSAFASEFAEQADILVALLPDEFDSAIEDFENKTTPSIR